MTAAVSNSAAAVYARRDAAEAAHVARGQPRPQSAPPPHLCESYPWGGDGPPRANPKGVKPVMSKPDRDVKAESR